MTRHRFVVQLLIALFTLSVTGKLWANALTPFKAEYTAYKWGEALGTASMELEWLAGQQYSLLYQSKVSKFFLSDKRSEHSIFSYDDGRISPSEYHYSRSGTGSDKQLHVVFDDEQKTINIDTGKATQTLPWQNETDNQLYRLALPLQLANNKKNLDVNFINYRGEKKQYAIRVHGNEQLSLPYGVLNTVKVKIVRQNSSRETYAWFAPEFDYLLVRLQQFKDGDEQGDIKLSRYVQK